MPAVAVDLMFARYVLYRDGGTTLADAANYFLTVIERESGGRKLASTRYAIDFAVLRKVGELTATKGGALARKAMGAAAEYTPAERQWLEQAMATLFRRAAEFASKSAAKLPRNSMVDFRAL